MSKLKQTELWSAPYLRISQQEPIYRVIVTDLLQPDVLTAHVYIGSSRQAYVSWLSTAAAQSSVSGSAQPLMLVDRQKGYLSAMGVSLCPKNHFRRTITLLPSQCTHKTRPVSQPTSQGQSPTRQAREYHGRWRGPVKKARNRKSVDWDSGELCHWLVGDLEQDTLFSWLQYTYV